MYATPKLQRHGWPSGQPQEHRQFVTPSCVQRWKGGLPLQERQAFVATSKNRGRSGERNNGQSTKTASGFVLHAFFSLAAQGALRETLSAKHSLGARTHTSELQFSTWGKALALRPWGGASTKKTATTPRLCNSAARQSWAPRPHKFVNN
jgi:hypothetical protein